MNQTRHGVPLNWRCVLVGLPLALAALQGSGCKTTKETFECNDICEEFKRCYDSDLNVNRCVDHCFDAIDKDKQLERDADKCADCIEEKSCSEVTKHCSTCEQVYMTFEPNDV